MALLYGRTRVAWAQQNKSKLLTAIFLLSVLGLLLVFVHKSSRPLQAHSAQQEVFPVQGTAAKTEDGNFVAFVEDPELQITAIIEQSLKTSTTDKSSLISGHGSTPLMMLDVGMNAGRFTVLAAKLGAAVYAVEPQPACVQHMSEQLASKELASLQQRVTIINAAVGSTASVMQVPLTGCNPSFGVGGVPRPAESAAAHQAVAVLPLSTFLRSFHRVAVAKVDVEGAEVQVLQQLLPLAQAGRLQQLVVELMPGNWVARGATEAEGVKVLQDLAAASKQVVLLTDPTPFKMAKKNVTVAGVPGPLHSGFDMQQLVKDRLSYDAPNEPLPHGCNVWFSFV